MADTRDLKSRASNGMGVRLPPSPPISKKGEYQMTGYCMKCKETREMKDAKDVVMKNGRPAVNGTCSVCGTKMFKIKKKSEA